MTRSARRFTHKAILIFIVLSLILPTPAFAMPIEEAQPLAPHATYTVTSTLDDGLAGTLRWAINQANANTGSDTIDFAIGTVDGVNTLDATTPVTITAVCTSGLVVINTDDSGCGSLRYAVSIATPGDTVTFTPVLMFFS